MGLKRGYRYLSALALMLYVVVVFAADVVSFMCSCEHHHTTHNHTTHHSYVCHDHTHHCCGVRVTDDCRCTHDHDTQINLYTLHRADDGQYNRLSFLLLAITGSYLYCDFTTEEEFYRFGEYILPQIVQLLRSALSLRAPPQLV